MLRCVDAAPSLPPALASAARRLAPLAARSPAASEAGVGAAPVSEAKGAAAAEERAEPLLIGAEEKNEEALEEGAKALVGGAAAARALPPLLFPNGGRARMPLLLLARAVLASLSLTREDAKTEGPTLLLLLRRRGAAAEVLGRVGSAAPRADTEEGRGGGVDAAVAGLRAEAAEVAEAVAGRDGPDADGALGTRPPCPCHMPPPTAAAEAAPPPFATFARDAVAFAAEATRAASNEAFSAAGTMRRCSAALARALSASHTIRSGSGTLLQCCWCWHWHWQGRFVGAAADWGDSHNSQALVCLRLSSPALARRADSSAITSTVARTAANATARSASAGC